MGKRRGTWKLAIAMTFGLLFPLPALALQSSYDVLNFIPTVDNSDYFTVYGSKTLDPRVFNMGIYVDYSHKVLECTGCPVSDVIDSLLVGDFVFSIGIAPRLQMGFNVPIIFYNEFNNDFTGTTQDDGGIGDIQFTPKIRLLDIEQYVVGLALSPFITFPTGDGQQFLGSGSFTGGARLIADIEISRRLGMALNLGYKVRDDVTRTSTQIDDEVLYALGMVIHATSKLDTFAELSGYTVLQDAWGSVAQSPLELDAGVRYRHDSGFAFTLGAGGGLVDGVGSPMLRGIAGINFSPPLSKVLTQGGREARKPHAEIKGDKIVVSERIYFDFDKSQLQAKSYPVLDAIVALLKEHPELSLLQVEGHTDNIGTAAYNEPLARARAKVAMEYLVSHGIAKSRLTYKGFGMSNPLVSNDFEEGQAINRRTEFTILAMSGKSKP